MAIPTWIYSSPRIPRDAEKCHEHAVPVFLEGLVDDEIRQVLILARADKFVAALTSAMEFESGTSSNTSRQF